MSGDAADDERVTGTDGTVCPFCAVGCRLDREGNRVRGRHGSANPDGRLCAKGLGAFDPVEDERRLTRPLVREGGELVAASWKSALERVVSSFEDIIETEGPDALAFLGAPRCTNEENYLLGKLARTVGTNNVDNRARLCHVETARTLEDRLGWPATTNRLADLRRADAFLVVGANPVARQPIAFDSYVRPAVDDGATLVHVDPHSNETTRTADVHVAPRPGTDAHVVTVLNRLLADVDGDSADTDHAGVDTDFVAERARGFERYRAWLETVDEKAATRTADVDVDRLETVAGTLRDADGVAVLTGTGADDAATADALVNLLALTGNLGRADCGYFLLRGLNNEQGATDAGCVPDRLPGHRPLSDPDGRADVAATWGVDLPATPGLDEHEQLAAFGDEIHGALVVGENPAISKREAAWVSRKLDALDALVVSELRRTETTERADVVLPAAAGVETAGTVTNLDRQVQRLRPLVEPPDWVRTDFELLCALGRGLVGSEFDYDGPGEVFEELSGIAPAYAGLSYDALDERSRRWPTGAREDGRKAERDGVGNEEREESRDEGVLYRDSFRTDDGRVALTPIDLQADDDSDATAGLRLVVGDRAGQFEGVHPAEDGDRITIHPADADARGVVDGTPVVVANDVASVETVAHVREAVRPGTVYMHASAGDPLVRGGSAYVTVEPAEE